MAGSGTLSRPKQVFKFCAESRDVGDERSLSSNVETLVVAELPHMISLNESSKIVVQSIHFSKNIYNVLFAYGMGCSVGGKSFTLGSGYYESIGVLVDELNHLGSSLDVAFKYERSSKISVNNKNSDSVKMTGALCRVCGFDTDRGKTERTLKAGITTSERIGDGGLGFSYVTLHSNLVRHHNEKTIGPSHSFGPFINESGSGHFNWNGEREASAISCRVKEIVFSIRDSRGLPVPFERGKIVVSGEIVWRPNL